MDYSFKNFQKNSIIRFLALDNYNYLKENLYRCNIGKDEEYQRRFNAFFRVRRDDKWRKVFYSYFEQVKNNKNISFDEILDYIYTKTGNIEASFCSKMLSIINPDMPIWDQYVLKNLNLTVNGMNKKERLEDTKTIYKKIIEIENDKLREKDIQQTIKEFKGFFPEYSLSDIKILDYILWNNR